MKNCPSDKQLDQLLNDQLAADQIDQISEHIETCQACQDRLEHLTFADQQYQSVSISIDQPLSENQEVLQRLSKRVLDEFAPQFEAAAQHQQTSLVADATIGDYQIIEPIGRGGMGTVYQARHTKLDRVVAIKVVEVDSFTDANRIARFRRESKAIGRLRHPNIVAAHDAGEQGNYHYLVMEYIDGIDLSHIIRNNIRVPVNDACEMIRQAAVGLQHSHQAGLVHRDIKPSNIMLSVVDDPPMVKLLDLGLAQIIDAASKTENQLTQPGRIIGTLDYMAPEQFDGIEVDIRADIYSLGTTLYALLSGKTPYNFGKVGMLQRIQKRATEQHLPLSTYCPDLPTELTDFVDQMLSTDPNDRPGQPQEVAEWMERFNDGHDLKRLAEQLPKPSRTSMNDTSVDNVTLDAGGSGFVPLTPSGRIDVHAAQTAPRSPKRTVGILIAFAIVALSALLWVLSSYWTDGGKIIVSADDPDLEIELIRDQTQVHRMRVSQLQDQNWFRSGQYEIRVAGMESTDESARVKISNPKFKLTRGQTQQVKISIEPINDVDQSMMLTGPETDPGKSFSLSFTPVCILFRNETRFKIDIVFVDFSGAEQPYAELPPDTSWNPSSGHGHLWRFYVDGKLLTFYQVQKAFNQFCVFQQSDPNDSAITVSTQIARPMKVDTDSTFQLHSNLFSDSAIAVQRGTNKLLLQPIKEGDENHSQRFRFIEASGGAYFIKHLGEAGDDQPEMVLHIPDITGPKLGMYVMKRREGLESRPQQFKLYRGPADFVRIVSVQSETVHIGIDEQNLELIAQPRSFDANTMFRLQPLELP